MAFTFFILPNLHHLPYHRCIPIDTHFRDTQNLASHARAETLFTLHLLISISRHQNPLLTPISGKSQNANLAPPFTPPPTNPNPHPRPQAHSNLPRHRHRPVLPQYRPRSPNIRLYRIYVQRRTRRPASPQGKIRPSMVRTIQVLFLIARSGG